MKFLGKWLDRLLVVAGALVFAQFPLFYAQYLHELSGHTAELSYQMNQMELIAKNSNKTVSELIAKFHQSSDIDIIRQGDFLQSLSDRYLSLKNSYQALSQADLLQKPFVFLQNLHQTIFDDTLKHFEWGISFSIEGLFYCLIGMAFGAALFQILKGLIFVPIGKLVRLEAKSY